MTPAPACRCGYLPCTADPDASIDALWRHIEEAHRHSQLHHGRYAWKNGAEQVWECADDCPHPSHEEMP